MTSRISRIVLALALSTAGVATGVVGTAFAVPTVNAFRNITTHSGPVTHDWPNPAFGAINGYSGVTYATGAGVFSDGGNNNYSESVTTHADSNFQGTITGVDDATWELDVNYQLVMHAKTHYVPTGWIPVMEDFRSEVQCALEVRGDFGPFGVEKTRIVDSYTTPGVTTYDAVGGGVYPMTYPDQGQSSVVAATADVVTNPFNTVLTFHDFTWKRDIEFNLYARANQFMKSDSEEDVSLYTTITAEYGSSGESGFNGTLTCWYVWGGQTLKAEFSVEDL